MAVMPIHGGVAAEAFDVVHRSQVVSFPAGRLEVDPLMRATIDASDADVMWDDEADSAEGEALGPPPAPRRPGRPRKRV